MTEQLKEPVLPTGRSFRWGCLRSLREEDAPGMLEWMHDPDVADKFRFDFMSMDEADALAFIRSSWDDNESIHLAVVGEDDGYLGTVSLKHVDVAQSCAEYAIAMVARSHGTGVALKATRDILALAFYSLDLHRVYLNVRADNGRALAFYNKAGFVREGAARSSLRVSSGGFVDLVWLSMLVGEFDFGTTLLPAGSLVECDLGEFKWRG
ncbi:GNAT family N-acetyltransferase [Adlercreutzia sp. ZJ141]|uniref:GNAT family N-acetyltransferase n=1 Tax=Adlercreutzia sp. ZJ141 TaxID=2709406 RepID=UPI0013EA497B|nr:GNAT family protein [Adlercreutzia sp. ZJ141]